jgi:ABC-type branched-subunit amino acid transport system permease subunit
MQIFQKIAAVITGNRWLMIALGVVGVVLVLGMPLLPFPQKNLWVRILGYAGLYILLGLGLLIHVGLAGMLDLGFAAYYGIGAYTCAFLLSDHFGLHLPFWLVLPIAGLVSALVGVLVCIPVLRTWPSSHSALRRSAACYSSILNPLPTDHRVSWA